MGDLAALARDLALLCRVHGRKAPLVVFGHFDLLARVDSQAGWLQATLAIKCGLEKS
jgi:hypothetical protein